MGKTVLIVDDSNTMRKIVSRALRQAGIDFSTILEAGDGQEALDVLSANDVDVILSDINMPNMNGLEFLKAKSEIAAIKDIPVVMISTETGADIIDEAKSYGAKGAIKKPFTPELINETLGALL
ncbi:response regulator [Pelovirga terrestris]|uniref:Response regulator n=1 Tax=Pelovirga terrestris TaxID=2771352 RepID=A0A8J6QVE0_9BACT|nr:response regulator [Pelovirga terrestris]MBD1401585.1 response regulator [Pelovirga terrestris]